MLKPLCVKFVCDYSYFKYFFRWNKLLFGESSNLYVVSVVPPNDPSVERQYNSSLSKCK